MTRRLTLALAVAMLGGWSPAAGAQSVVARSPNIAGGWTAAPGVIQLNLLHRFSISDPPLRKITNTPTFNVGTGVTSTVMVGFVYGSNSRLVPAYPNEWEFYARALPVAQARGAPLDVAVQGGYNLASESIDGELLLARSLGRVRLLAAGRAFSEAYAGDESRFAVTGGAALSLTPRVALAGDYGALLDRSDDERPAWSAGLQVGVPYTPHSFSIHATNVGTASLEGTSRGLRTRWGFEYTIPITVRRYVPSSGDDEDAEDREDMAGAGAAMGESMATADTVFVDIKNLAYGKERIEIAPGTTVVWRNMDPIQHSVTSPDSIFDSRLIEPGKSFTWTFTDEGTFPFHCVPHPFMKGTVVVSGMRESRPLNEGGAP